MRFVLVLLAVIGLLASPVAAAAAQAACHDDGQTMMSMPMAGMPGMSHADGQKADPCCDPGKDPGQPKHDASSCLQACAVMCGVVAALPAATAVPLIAPEHIALDPSRMASLEPHEPSRLERPPRSIA